MLQQIVIDYLQVVLEIENTMILHSLILPRKTVFQLCSLLAETSDQLTMQTSENKIKFTLGKMKLISKVIDGKFPDYKKVVPLHNDKTLIVHQKILLVQLKE